MDYDSSVLQKVCLGSAVVGAVSGCLGTFAVLRKQSLLGDAVSHAALPGIVLAFLLTLSREPMILVFGAVLAGWSATMVVAGIVRTTRVPYDSALGLVLSVFFGFGLMMLSWAQTHVTSTQQAALETYLFGEAATLLWKDVWTVLGLGLLAVLGTVVFWKQFALLCFDPDHGRCLGYRMRLYDVLLTSLLVLAIVVGLKTVGVVLMSALIVAPAAAARQWTNRLGILVFVASGFGVLAGVAGAVLSSHPVTQMPTGPAVVLCMTALVFFSFLFAPQRGLLMRFVRHLRNRRRLQLESVLCNLYRLESQHASEHPHSLAVLQAMGKRETVLSSLRELARRELVRHHPPDLWILTPLGRTSAEHCLSEAGEKRE